MRTMKRWACFGHAVGKGTSRRAAARWAYRIGWAGLALLLVSGAPAAPGAAPDTATKARVDAAFGQLPLPSSRTVGNWIRPSPTMSRAGARASTSPPRASPLP